MKRLLRLLVIIFSISQLSILCYSCTQDAYDKGEGEYSLLRADFVEAFSNGEKKIDRVVTDDGEQYTISNPFSMKWVTTPDSTYRCILYYNYYKAEDGSAPQTAEAVSAGQVACPQVVPLAQLDKEMKTDPVKFESAWMSRSGKYLNLSLYLMTGKSDDEEASHHLAVVQDTIMQNTDNTRTCYLRLFHDQGAVPEYYSTQVYASILTKELDADSVQIYINTYKGEFVKAFPVR